MVASSRWSDKSCNFSSRWLEILILFEEAKTQRVQFFSGPAFSNLQVVPSQNKQKQEGMAKGRRTIQEQDFKAGNSELRYKAVVSVVHSTNTWLEFKHF
jgi:hypothetical protein